MGIMGVGNPIPGSEAGESQFKHKAVASAYGSRRREHTKTFGFDRRRPVLVCASAGRAKDNATKHWFKGLAVHFLLGPLYADNITWAYLGLATSALVVYGKNLRLYGVADEAD